MFLAETSRICETAIQYGARYFRGWNKRRLCAHSIMQKLRSLFDETQWNVTTTELSMQSIGFDSSSVAMAFSRICGAQIMT